MARTITRRGKSATEVMDKLIPPTRGDLALRQQMIEDLEVAELIHEARQRAGLTQAQLARKVGTTQSVISKLEGADYEGHSMAMLRRIAHALGLEVRIAFVPRNDAA